MKNIKRLVSILCIFALFSAFGFSEESESKEDLTPVWVKDLRRTEIVTFGSLPFVSIGVTIGYGAYLYNTGRVKSFPNIFDKTTINFDSNQVKEMFGISMGICAGIGLTDLLITVIKRNVDESRQLQMLQGNAPEVVPMTPEQAKEILLRNSETSEEKDDLLEESFETDVVLEDSDQIE